MVHWRIWSPWSREGTVTGKHCKYNLSQILECKLLEKTSVNCPQRLKSFVELTIQSIILICVIQDETFLVRDCSKKSKSEPYVLVVYYGRRVYNIKVRFLEDSQQYALGTGLRGDDVSKIPSTVTSRLLLCHIS